MSANIKIRWLRQDNYGAIRAAFLGVDGKLHYPTYVGAIWADLSEAYLRNSPGIKFDVNSCGAVYRIGGNLVVVESCGSKVFKPLASVIVRLAARRPVIAKHGKALAFRAELAPSIVVC